MKKILIIIATAWLVLGFNYDGAGWIDGCDLSRGRGLILIMPADA